MQKIIIYFKGPAYYKFEYGVHDPHTGDIKSQYEHRDGKDVTGGYTIMLMIMEDLMLLLNESVMLNILPIMDMVEGMVVTVDMVEMEVDMVDMEVDMLDMADMVDMVDMVDMEVDM
ncbi:hypothetical protein BDFB_012845, partial [Asbolus verrucosus]